MSKRGLATLLAVIVAALVASSLALWLTSFHKGAEFCGSVHSPAFAVQDSDPCEVALSSRQAVMVLLSLGAGVIVLGSVVGLPVSMLSRRRRADTHAKWVSRS